jgi:membrane protein YdbS with pleckstrin-like domain
MQLLKLQALEISTAGSNYHIIGIDGELAKKIVLELEEYLKLRIEVLANEEI